MATLESQVIIQLLCCDITFDSIFSLTLKHLTITGAAQHNLVMKDTPATQQQLHIDGIILFESSLTYTYNASNSLINLIIQDSNFEQSSGTGLQITDMRSQGMLILNIMNSSTSYNQQGGIIIKDFLVSHTSPLVAVL